MGWKRLLLFAVASVGVVGLGVVLVLLWQKQRDDQRDQEQASLTAFAVRDPSCPVTSRWSGDPTRIIIRNGSSRRVQAVDYSVSVNSGMFTDYPGGLRLNADGRMKSSIEPGGFGSQCTHVPGTILQGAPMTVNLGQATFEPSLTDRVTRRIGL